jgi:hypothetical protein
MDKTIGLQLVGYSLLLAGLSCFVQHLAPALARLVIISGLAGGALCLVWGFRATTGNRGKALPLLTLVIISFVMLSQTVLTWGDATKQVPGQTVASVVITVLFVLSMAMLMRVAYAGVVFDGQDANPPKGGQPPTSGKQAARSNAEKRT